MPSHSEVFMAFETGLTMRWFEEQIEHNSTR